MSVLGEGVTIGNGNVVSNGARLFPGVDAARRSAALLMATLDREAVAAVDSTDQIDEITDLPDPPARRAVARRLGRRSRRRDTPGGIIVAGMGGSAVGGRLAAGALGSRAAPPADRARRLRAAGLGRAGDARAVLELLGDDRGDARRLRRRRRARRAADRGDDRRPAGRARPARRRAGDPGARRLPAARCGRLLARLRARGGRSLRRRARRCATRSRRLLRSPKGSRPSGARTVPRTARPRRSPAGCTAPSR